MTPIVGQHIISTRAPREGSDHRRLVAASWTSYFNPRSPRGERPQFADFEQRRIYFNPRSPRGERQKPR